MNTTTEAEKRAATELKVFTRLASSPEFNPQDLTAAQLMDRRAWEEDNTEKG
jgi:hypothetical protein